MPAFLRLYVLVRGLVCLVSRMTARGLLSLCCYLPFLIRGCSVLVWPGGLREVSCELGGQEVHGLRLERSLVMFRIIDGPM
jgi:hypothetical protein